MFRFASNLVPMWPILIWTTLENIMYLGQTVKVIEQK